MDAMSTLGLDSASKAATTGAAKALAKGLVLVDVVADRKGPVRLSDLVETSGLPRPTVVRLLDALLEAGALRSEASGGYALGPRLLVWGQAYLNALDLPQQAQEPMQALVEESRETCFLGVRHGSQVLYVAKVDSPMAVRPAATVSSLNPLHSTAMGKALLAFADPELIDSYLERRLESRTPNTIVDPQRLRKELTRVRARDYSVDEVENEEGVRCIAAPVRDHTGDVVAAVSLSAPAYRFSADDPHRWAPRVQAAAAVIAKHLGHSTGPDSRLATLSTDSEEDA
jgi:DNA-binding IclR family transcriptional regulator